MKKINALLAALMLPLLLAAGGPQEVPVFITLGQSNADGSAMFDPQEDARLKAWYDSPANPHTMKMWYRSSKVQNQPANSRGEYPRRVIDGDTVDAGPGWLELWYRNENTSGRTAMNMIHGYGTYSTGPDTNCAQGRRGMEGEFGMKFQSYYPGSELYMLKLGASGSHISAWAYPEVDGLNWKYFMDNIYRPAIDSLLKEGKRPKLAGIWWMQGCADSGTSREYYEARLRKLVEQCRTELGFPDAHIYIGHVIKPGEAPDAPGGSVQFGQGVRDAQDAVAADIDGVETVDTRGFQLQYEKGFNGYLHYSHKGVNAIGDELARRVAAEGPSHWDLFTTPGSWVSEGGEYRFVPTVGHPRITYKKRGRTITATLHYPGWKEKKVYKF